MMMCPGSTVTISALIFICAVIHGGRSVKINKLQVPSVTEHGAPVTLDCDFTLEATDEGLVVKWLFTKNNSLVYQWIPGPKSKPQDLGILRGRLNLDYKSGVDANSIHRALHILQPGPDLSGEYTCVVSTFQSEDKQTKSMLVFVPERHLTLRRVASDIGLMRVQCHAEGVFPIPDMILRSQQRTIPDSSVKTEIRDRSSIYDVTATVLLEALPDSETFSCELRIAQANYTRHKETVIFPGSSGVADLHSSQPRWPTLTPCMVLSAWAALQYIHVRVLGFLQ